MIGLIVGEGTESGREDRKGSGEQEFTMPCPNVYPGPVTRKESESLD